MSFRCSKSVNDVTRIDRDSDVSDAEVDSDGSDDVFQLQLQVRPPISVGRLFGLTGCTCKLKIKFVNLLCAVQWSLAWSTCPMVFSYCMPSLKVGVSAVISMGPSVELLTNPGA